MFEETQARYKTNKEIEIIRLEQVKVDKTDWASVMDRNQLGRKIIDEIGNNSQEVVVIVGFNAKNEIKFLSKVFVGGLRSALSEPRPIFQRLLLNGCTSFVMAHNHPSGNLSPSDKDIDFVKRLKKCEKILGIKLLDSLIVTEYAYSSMAERKLL